MQVSDVISPTTLPISTYIDNIYRVYVENSIIRLPLDLPV